ncbi:conserved hypothetical protein [Pseudoclavibacter sp. 8L]|nr:conserved hypothetical protein [Pseudoclavibacter sp. 8L]
MDDPGQATPVERRLSRRTFMYSVLGAGGLAVGSYIAFAPEAGDGRALAKVPMFAAPSRRLFDDREQVLAPYLMTVAPMANDVVDDPDAEAFGFMAGGWWRPVDAQTKTNSRIMEQVATLAWFCANQRDWNPLYQSTALLARLEAAVGYYTSLQLEDGSYPEQEGNSSLAATAFGLTAQADAYEALVALGVSGPTTLQLRGSIERAVAWFMNKDADHWAPPVILFNQVAAGLVGAQRALQVLSQAPVDQSAISERIAFLCANGQASAGFFHEPYGVDFGYNFTVAMPDIAWLLTQTNHPDLVPLVTRYMDFMQYAVLPEPGSGSLWHIPALHVRNVTTVVSRPRNDLSDRAALARVLLSSVPSIALFLSTSEEKAQARSDFRSASDPIRPLPKRETSPRTWMYGRLAPDGPSKKERDAVEAGLPVLTAERFSKLENGSAHEQYLFVRRPSYFVASVFGFWIKTYKSTRQLGTLWSPTLGTILVGTNNPTAAEGWETLGPAGEFSTRQSSSTSEYFDSRTSTESQKIDALKVREKTTLFAQRAQSDAGSSEYTVGWGYWDQGLRFTFLTQREGECTQRLPILLKDGDTLTMSDGSTFSSGDDGREVLTSSLVLNRDGGRVLFDLGLKDLRVFITPTGNEMSGGEIHRVGVLFETQIAVNTVFLEENPSEPMQAEAHRHSNGDVSIRITVYPPGEKSISQIRITGTGLGTEIDLPEPGFQVLERTITPRRAGATTITVNAYSQDGSGIGEITAKIR